MFIPQCTYNLLEVEGHVYSSSKSLTTKFFLGYCNQLQLNVTARAMFNPHALAITYGEGHVYSSQNTERN